MSPHGDVTPTKVKAHATAEDVQQGLISLSDFVSISSADALAVAGACLIDADGKLRDQARQQMTIALSVQQMMLEILCTRRINRSNTCISLVAAEDAGSSSNDSAVNNASNALSFCNVSGMIDDESCSSDKERD